jgi:hypothetical protein
MEGKFKNNIPKYAVAQADALIAELNKEKQ